MSMPAERMEFEELKKKAHEIEDKMHGPETGCMTADVSHLKEELIDVTEKMDELKEKLHEPIEKEY